MTEEVLFEVERRQSRDEIADYLRTVADKLSGDGAVTLGSGDDSVTLTIPERPTFEVEVEREGTGDAAELSVEFELEWDEGGDDSGGSNGELSIE